MTPHRAAPLLLSALLAACAAPPPGSRPAPQGVGFGSPVDYAAERAAREAQLAGRAPAPSGVPGAVPDAALSAPVYAPYPSGAGGISAGSAAGNPAMAPAAGAPGLSDEQSFDAVADRETIQSDAERLAQARAAYLQVQPGALPTRPDDAAPNIAAYALAAPNARGEAAHARRGASAARSARACAGYTSPDLAQIAFLQNGGPARDPRNLDPDGDGFACAWDPAPFRAARR